MGLGLEEFASNALQFGETLALSNEQQHRASDAAGRAQDFSAAQVKQQEDFQREMRSTQYQTATKDMLAAGLNPMLAYSQGGAGNLSGSSASGAIAPTPQMQAPPAGFSASTAAQIRNLDATANNIDADTRVKQATEQEIIARTPTHAVNIAATKATIDRTIADTSRLIQETKTGAASAAQIEQNTTNLRALLPQIEATTAQIRAHTKLTTAQTGLTDTETQKLNQAVQQNLPKLEAALASLKVQAEKMAQPGRENAAAAQASYIGQLGAYLDAINPLKGFLGVMR